MKSLYCQVDINYFKPTTAHIQSSATLNEEGDGNNYRKLITKYRKDKTMRNVLEVLFEVLRKEDKERLGVHTSIFITDDNDEERELYKVGNEFIHHFYKVPCKVTKVTKNCY